MPLTDRSQAKEGGFGQVREALQKFEATVSSAEFDMWGGKLVDDEGKPIAPREFLEITCTDVLPLEVTEDLSMDISELYSFRVNCSEFKGSFWVDKFLESADKLKLLVPDGLVGKRITFQKVTLEAKDPKYNSTSYVMVGVKAAGAAKVVKVTAPAATVTVVTPTPVATEPVEVTAEQAAVETAVVANPMDIALALAIGKTETQFRTAISLDPTFAGSPLLPLAKAGAITQALLNESKLVLVDEKYQLPG